MRIEGNQQCNCCSSWAGDEKKIREFERFQVKDDVYGINLLLVDRCSLNGGKKSFASHFCSPVAISVCTLYPKLFENRQRWVYLFLSAPVLCGSRLKFLLNSRGLLCVVGHIMSTQNCLPPVQFVLVCMISSKASPENLADTVCLPSLSRQWWLQHHMYVPSSSEHVTDKFSNFLDPKHL